jgi:hypothetical protein
MAGKLITLPLRISLSYARFVTRIAGGTAERVVSLAGRTVAGVAPGRSTAQHKPAATEPPRQPRDVREAGARDVPEAGARDVPEAGARDVPEAGARDGQTRDAQQPASPDPRARPPSRPRAQQPVARSAPPTPQRRAASEPPPAPAVQEPVHVSEQPELVREEAERGAEEGAGAAVTVLEPWNGYENMSARDVIARTRTANRAELAAVRLYESRHRSRQTVLAAVDRQLRLANGGQPA